MNDDQTDKLIKILGDAFDKAAIYCTHKEAAARVIYAAIAEGGFKIEPRKSAKRAA